MPLHVFYHNRHQQEESMTKCVAYELHNTKQSDVTPHTNSDQQQGGGPEVVTTFTPVPDEGLGQSHGNSFTKQGSKRQLLTKSLEIYPTSNQLPPEDLDITSSVNVQWPIPATTTALLTRTDLPLFCDVPQATCGHYEKV